jgi:predicted DNA-binding transcriptional regulator YafY
MLEQAIYHRKEIVIDYKAKEDVVQHTVKPYKIVFMNENFYLACEVEHPDYQFSPYRISKIVDITPTGKSFHQNREIASFIKDMQTPLARYIPDYKEHRIEVLVEVEVSRAHYFKSKKYLPSQEIIEEKEDGTLVLSYTVTQEMELIDIVKRWIPHMRVITPTSLKERIHKDLTEYLK